MYKIQIGKWTFTYLVGNHTVAIITPSKKKHIAKLHTVANPALAGNRVQNGSADGRISPEEVAAYVVQQRLI